MRTICKLCLAIGVLSAMMLAQTVVQRVPGANPPAALRPDTGTLDGQTYTNEYFALRYTLPDAMSPAQDGVAPRSAGNTFVLLAARGTSSRTLVMMADWAHSYGDPADGNAYLREVTPYMSAQGFETVRESAEHTYAGQKFFRADYKKGPVYRSAVFTVRSGYALGLSVAAATPEEINDLCDSLNSLVFTGPERRVRVLRMEPAPAPTEGHVLVGPVPEASNNLPSWSSGAQPGEGCEQSPDQNAPTRVRISAAVAESMLCRDKILCGDLTAPVYPPLARAARIQGSVVLHAIIGCDGTVRELHTISGHPMLVQAAIDAVRQWRYRRYILNGKPVETDTIVTVKFTLREDPVQ